MEESVITPVEKVAPSPQKKAMSSIEENIRFIVRTILKEELKPLMTNLIHDDLDVQAELSRCVEDDVESKVSEYFDSEFDSKFEDAKESLTIEIDQEDFNNCFRFTSN